MGRARLFDRREAESFEIEHEGLKIRLTVGYYADHKSVGEVFVDVVGPRASSDVAMLARDAGIIISLALQHFTSVETMRGALLRHEDGRPVTLIGTILDSLAC